MTPAVLDALTAARARTLDLLAPFDDDALTAQHSPLMSPLVWDLAHIAHYEELWLVRELGVGPATEPRFDDVYDAFKHPRAERPTLDLLDPEGARAFGEAVRLRVTDAGIPPTGEPRVDALLAGDFVYRMVVRHEHQHMETMLATIQLMDDAGVAAGDGPGAASARPGAAGDEVLVPAGPFVMGTDTDPWAYDNERPAHAVELPAFLIDATPTTNAEFVAFIEAGGYDDPAHWSDAGWKWRQEAALAHPEFWSHRPDGWHRSAVRPRRARPAARAGAARVLVRGRRVRAVGRQAAAVRGGVGEGRELGRAIGRRREAPGAVGPRRRVPRPTTSGVRADGSDPTRSARTPTVRRRTAPSISWAGSGNGRPRTSTAIPASPASRTGSTPRSSSDRSTRCCGAAPGPRIQWRSAPPSATGTTRSDARSSADSAAPGTPDRVPTPRLPRTAARRARARLRRTARARAPGSRTARDGRREGQPRRLGRRVVDPGFGGAAALSHHDGHVGGHAVRVTVTTRRWPCSPRSARRRRRPPWTR